MLYTIDSIDVASYIKTRYCIQHVSENGQTLVRLGTKRMRHLDDIHVYVSFVTSLRGNDPEMSIVLCAWVHSIIPGFVDGFHYILLNSLVQNFIIRACVIHEGVNAQKAGHSSNQSASTKLSVFITRFLINTVIHFAPYLQTALKTCLPQNYDLITLHQAFVWSVP